MSDITKVNLYNPNKQYGSGQFIERRKGDRRSRVANVSFPASLMVHIIADHQRLINEPKFARQPLDIPTSTYRKTAVNNIRRMPAGFTQQNIV